MATVIEQSEFRQAQRSNTLMTARALVGDTAWTVWVRNLSACGALVESDVKVDAGCSIVTTRGRLRVTGEVAWRREGVFGVKFFEPLAVEEWVNRPTRTAIAPDVFQKGAPLSGDMTDSVLTQRLSEEISLVARMVARTTELLSEDPILRVRHALQLQELCMGEQMLVEISAVLTEKDKHTAIRHKATGSMRNRLLR